MVTLLHKKTQNKERCYGDCLFGKIQDYKHHTEKLHLCNQDSMNKITKYSYHQKTEDVNTLHCSDNRIIYMVAQQF